MDAPRRLEPGAPVTADPPVQPMQFWPVTRSGSRMFFWALFAAFALSFLAAWADVIDRRLMIFGLLGLPIVGFILWATTGEDSGERPACAIDSRGLVIDPAGDNQRFAWDAMVGFLVQPEGRLLLTVRDVQKGCGSCAPVVRTVPLDPGLKAPGGFRLGDVLLAQAARRGIQIETVAIS